MTGGKQRRHEGSGYKSGGSFMHYDILPRRSWILETLGQEDCELETSQLYIEKLTQKQNVYLGSQFICVHDARDLGQMV